MNKDVFNAMRVFFVVVLSFCFLLIANVSYALPFTIVPKAGTVLPTTVSAGATATAYYTVYNNTRLPRANNAATTLPPYVAQVTQGGTYGDTCGRLFNLAAKGQPGDSCTLQLTISNTVTPTCGNLLVCFPGEQTCAGTEYPLNVTQTPVKTLAAITITPIVATITQGSTQQYTAIGTSSDNSQSNITTLTGWNSSDAAVATIGPTGLATGVAVGGTTITASLMGVTSNPASLLVSNPLLSIAITPVAVTLGQGFMQQYTAIGTYANGSQQNITTIVNWNSSNTGVATISSTGLATTFNAGTTLITASLNGITSNTGTLTVILMVYLPNESKGINACSVEPNGTISNCNLTAIGLPSLALAITSSIRTGYVISPTSNTLTTCRINSNGSFSTCLSDSSLPGIPNDLAINPAETFAYITVNSNVYSCPITSSGSGPCVATNSGTGGIPNAYGVTINSAGTFAYVTNNTSDVYYCPITNGGRLNGCTNIRVVKRAAHLKFLTINAADSYAYIVDSNLLYRCLINTNGSLGSCLPTGKEFTSLVGIGINITGTLMYVRENSGDVYYCSIIKKGLLDTCNLATMGLGANILGRIVIP